MADKEEYVGPVTVRPEQLQPVVDLANRVFRASGGDMGREYPLQYSTDCLEKLRIFEKDRAPVSVVATTINDAVLLGCSVRLALVGSVCTDESARGRGLAGRLMDDAAERAVSVGASVMLISGGRTLYTRRGAGRCGVFHTYTMPADSLPAPDAGLTVSEVTVENADVALRICRAEPIRFRRTLAEHSTQIACGWVRNKPGRTFLISRSGQPVATVSVSRDTRSADGPVEKIAFVEVSGSRSAIVASLSTMAAQFGAEEVEIEAYPTDYAMREALTTVGAGYEITEFHGTVKVLDVGMLWRDFVPLVRERAGAAADAVQVSSQADKFKIHTLRFEMGSDEFEIRDPAAIPAAFFGSKELDPLKEAPGELGSILRLALPLPLPVYGLNYV